MRQCCNLPNIKLARSISLKRVYFLKKDVSTGRRSRAAFKCSLLFDNTSSKINRAINMVFKGGM